MLSFIDFLLARASFVLVVIAKVARKAFHGMTIFLSFRGYCFGGDAEIVGLVFQSDISLWNY